jgi:CubicO group peptidase (beta-lactamase class C family)
MPRCAEVCDFSLDWTPGTRPQYHPRAAHLTQAMVIEAVTGQDYGDVIRDEVVAPLGSTASPTSCTRQSIDMLNRNRFPLTLPLSRVPPSPRKRREGGGEGPCSAL